MRFLIRYYEGILRPAITRWQKRREDVIEERNDPFYTPRLDRGVAGHERMEKSVEIPGNSSISGRAHHLLPGRIAPACSSPSPNRRKVCIRPSEFSGDEQLLRRRPLGSFHRLRNPGITCLFEGIIWRRERIHRRFPIPLSYDHRFAIFSSKITAKSFLLV